jgi:hypothetical protein
MDFTTEAGSATANSRKLLGSNKRECWHGYLKGDQLSCSASRTKENAVTAMEITSEEIRGDSWSSQG